MDSRSGMGLMVGLMQQSARLMSAVLPGHEWQEAQNKLETFKLFAWADTEIGMAAGTGKQLHELCSRALQMDPFQSIWALEGIASQYAASLQQPAEGMLSQGAGALLPSRTLVSLHAGMGTAFSRTLLSKLSSQPSKAAIQETVNQFVELCRRNSRTGWFENALEPLGLAVRTMHPHLLRPVSDTLFAMDPSLQRLFWHGVGRSLYFVPTNFATVGQAHRRALEAAVHEAPGIDERRNAVAGLVWAVTLVNLRHPEVLRNLIGECDRIRMREPAINGIVSALMLWKFMVPGDAALLPPYFRPVAGSGAELWQTFVMRPTARAFAEDFPGYVASGSIAPVFEYYPPQQAS